MKCIDLLYPLFLRIIHRSIKASVFPDTLKFAIITPVFKNPSADIEDFKNYRPVSSIPFLVKVLEKVIQEQLSAYTEEKQLFPTYQSSYKEHYLCETAPIRITDDIQKLISKEKMLYYCYLIVLLPSTLSIKVYF